MPTLPEPEDVRARQERGEPDADAPGEEHEDPADEDSEPGGDAYHHHTTPIPPHVYLNPGAPVIPEEYRTPHTGRRPHRPG